MQIAVEPGSGVDDSKGENGRTGRSLVDRIDTSRPTLQDRIKHREDVDDQYTHHGGEGYYDGDGDDDDARRRGRGGYRTRYGRGGRVQRGGGGQGGQGGHGMNPNWGGRRAS